MFETWPTPIPLIPTSPIAKGTRCFPHSMGIRATQRVDQPELLPWHSCQRQQWLPHLCQTVHERPTRDLLSSSVAQVQGHQCLMPKTQHADMVDLSAHRHNQTSSNTPAPFLPSQTRPSWFAAENFCNNAISTFSLVHPFAVYTDINTSEATGSYISGCNPALAAPRQHSLGLAPGGVAP